MSTSATKLCPLRFVWERFLLRPNQRRKRRTAATQIFLSPLPISTAIWRLTGILRDSQREEMPKVRHSYIGCANLSQSLEPLFKSEVKPFGFVAGPTLIIHAFLHQQWEYPKKQRAVLGTCGFGLGWPQTLDVHPSSWSVPLVRQRPNWGDHLDLLGEFLLNLSQVFLPWSRLAGISSAWSCAHCVAHTFVAFVEHI